MSLSPQAYRGLLVALGYRVASADEFQAALFVKQPISPILQRVIIDAMARKDEAEEVINALQSCGHTLSAKALARFKQMLGGYGNVDTRAALAEILPLLQGACSISMRLLAYSGITNTGSSVITGDIGVFHTDSITGFPPGTVSGTIHHLDAAASAAAAAAQALYTSYSTHSATAIPAVLDGQSLGPGYYGTGAASLDGGGALTLTGSASDLFVITCASTLVTGSSGTPVITLAGGAVASNVYWIVGSSATINSGHAGTFYGNVIAQASCTDTLGGTIHGSLTALNGAVTLSAASVVGP